MKKKEKKMNIKKILMLLLFLVAIAGIIAPASAAIDSVNSKDKVVSVESKEKSAANKITWNANGGIVGSKKTITTNVKKGSKIGKLPTTPKRSGYTFNGWYTKKTGGTKISKDIKPTKSVNYYAQWKKQNTKTLNADEKALVGRYRDNYGSIREFKADGTYLFYPNVNGKGKWVLTSKGAIHITNYIEDGYKEDDTTYYYTLGKKNGKSGIFISTNSPNDLKNALFCEKR